MNRYWLPSSVLVGLVTVADAASAADPDPSSVPRPGTTYRVHKGDTCVSIVTRAYGDRRRIDLMHKANPGLGPQPHHLVEGTELILPVANAPSTTSPDAKLGAVRNVVQVEAPERKPGKVDDPLYRGNRVSTEQRSGADVMFRDESELRLGEKTLVIILGDTKRRVREESVATTLVSGELTARLEKLGSISTEGASAAVKGEARISVDTKRTTRVATSRGATTLSAQKKSVSVPAGYGSKAEIGKAPTPPKLLPPAPAWKGSWPTLAMAPNGKTTSVRGELAPPGDHVAGVRVQVAHDAEFHDLISDVFVSKTTTHIEAEGLVPGRYFVRVASVDDDDFVGLFASALSVQVTGYREDRHADGTVSIAPDDASIRCTDKSVAADGRRVSVCASGDGSRQTEIAWAGPPPVVAKAKPSPPPEVVPIGKRERDAGFEVGMQAGVGFGRNTAQPGVMGALDACWAAPLGPGAVVLGLALGVEGYPRDDRAGVRFEGPRVGRVDVSHFDLGVGIPIGYRFGGRHAHLLPILQVQPELIWQHGSYSGAGIGTDVSASSALFAFRGTVGSQVRLGEWAFSLEGGYRISTAPASASAPFRGPLFLFGLHRFFD